ncbi:hypothetical protein [Streptomyces sp. ITFR-16]|uniref:hypothetical protein n=1 Tax=Streptomyces sp. ITFR-16 TaxID=3075198 RepID=UPI00288BF718|nr:hypothetical protein [Streptomyces sp. ITFR-16]WNI26612.1 hypothetical protein RLT58_34110 [Streptomyces sp. ITFR-16]
MPVWNMEGVGPHREAVEGLIGRVAREEARSGANAPSADAFWRRPPDRPAA